MTYTAEAAACCYWLRCEQDRAQPLVPSKGRYVAFGRFRNPVSLDLLTRGRPLTVVCLSPHLLQATGKYGAKRKHEELNDELLALIKVRRGGLVFYFCMFHRFQLQGVLCFFRNPQPLVLSSLASKEERPNSHLCVLNFIFAPL